MAHNSDEPTTDTSLREPRPPDLPRHEQLVDERLVCWYFLAALAYLLVSMSGGFLMAFQLIRHNPLNGIELFSPGRWRMVHTNAIAYGFLANAFLGMLHWVIPRLTLRPVLDSATVVVHLHGVAGRRARPRRSASCWARLKGWNGARRRSGSIRWPSWACCWSPSTSWHRSCISSGPMYVTLWYFIAAFVWTFLTYAMGNFVPAVLRVRNERRGGRRAVHSRPRRAVRHAAGLGTDVLLRARSC